MVKCVLPEFPEVRERNIYLDAERDREGFKAVDDKKEENHKERIWKTMGE